MKLQFFNANDLCKVIEKILETHPEKHIFNVGNEELCYKVLGTPLEKEYVTNHDNQRDYFSFYDYEYSLDVSRQCELLEEQKDYMKFIDENFE